MKFGRNLPRNQVPEWASSYINYKALKKLIKVATDTAKHGGTIDTAGISHCFIGLIGFTDPKQDSSTPSIEILKMSIPSTTKSMGMWSGA